MSSNSVCNHTRAVVRFCYHLYDYRPNWTPLSPITITYYCYYYYLLYHSLCWCLFVHQPGAYHVPGASDTQVIHSDHTLSTFLRIRADPSMLIFWVSVTLALSATLLMFSTIPFFIVPSAPTTQGSLQFSSATFSVFKTLGLLRVRMFSVVGGL